MAATAEKYNSQSSPIGSEALLAKFAKVAKDHFQVSLKNESDPILTIKENIRFFSLDLPAEIKEIFIPYADAPFFWIYESSLLTQIEEFLKFNFNRSGYQELHKQIKESYARWATTKLKSEKEYFATTTINFIERDINKHNFFRLILKAIILTYQSTFYNPTKALEILKSCSEIISTLRLNDNVKIELNYLINLYIGFVYIKENNFEKANVSFKEAIEIKQQGCSAKLYAAYSETVLGHFDLASYYLNEVYNYDVQRLGVAIKMNNLGMFNYFFRNAFIYNVFHEKDFCKAVDSIEVLLADKKNVDLTFFEKLKEGFDKIKIKKLDEYFNDEIKKHISFLEKAIPNYSKSSNSLLYSTFPMFLQQLEQLTDLIKEQIKNSFYAEIKTKLNVYDTAIKDNASAEKHLHDELEKFKVKTKEQLAEVINNINESYDLDTRTIEEHIANLPNLDKYNPRVSISNNMTYNVIVAFIVFFVGGFAGYSNRAVNDVSEFNSIFTIVLISGSKWGVISFIIGTIISIIVSGFIVIERFDAKSKLQRKINYLRLERERTLTEAKNSSVQKEKLMIENMTSSIQQHKKRIEELKEQRITAEKGFKEEADEKIAEVVKGLPLKATV